MNKFHFCFLNFQLVQVALKDSRTGETFCGGTILSPNWIISSAKCLKQQNFKLINFLKNTILF